MATRWLFKTEPSVYSYQQLEKDKKTMWDGVANNLALKNLKDIQKGDQILIYHTGDERQVVDIEAVKPLPKPVTLAEVKANKKLANFDLVRLSRLSIMKVSDDQWKILEGMAER